ncbi:MAG: NADH-quinone oxidoreductase subunit NuoH [Magnetococcales bacterium]|nr:NADH-quinone oxidoreductase subunit NuoH [Magnetococcales bacterium]NGZ05999.1 NADH-quinone oxidoreductase subunit NuoH [Magnetococcales bacterium]
MPENLKQLLVTIHGFGEGLLGPTLWVLAWTVIKIVILLAPVLFMVTYITLAERKIIGFMQVRYGPNRVGIWGILQPLADAAKLIFKELLLPEKADRTVFFLAPALTLVPALIAWAVIPFAPGLVLADINIGILYILAVSSLGVYGIIMAGWGSNNRFSFLGGLRSAAQMVSYEVSMGFTLIPVVLLSGSLNLTDVVNAQKGMWFVIPLLPMFVVYFISVVAETNRAPFDLPEAEAELVAGFITEYSAMSSGLFFMGEYANMILVSFMGSILFLGGWLPPLEILSFIPGVIWLGIKAAFLLFVFLWIRATFPRYRYDQLMRLGWKVFLPISLLWIFVTGLGVLLFGKA